MQDDVIGVCLGDNIPLKRRSKLFQWFGYKLLQKLGWRVVGEFPDIEKCVIIAAPHTSNYDGVIGLAAVLALDLDLTILGKHSLFNVPLLAQMLAWVGMIPVNRNHGQGLVEQIAHQISQADKMFLGLTPEGTRRGGAKWKTGFYRVAVMAQVPILPVAIDYGEKAIKVMPLFHPTDCLEKDIDKIVAFFRGAEPAHRDRLSRPLQ